MPLHAVPVSFPTLDGVTLRGVLFPAETGAEGPSTGPAVVLTPGFACVKEMFVPDVAAAFQRAGITALTYDPRCTGESGGLPRQEIEPGKLVSDYSDAISFLRQQPAVDPARVAVWGFSFSSTIALNVAALDKRVAAVIALCPLTDFTFAHRKAKVLAKTMKDRESQLQGNDPVTIPILTAKGENPVGFGGGGTASEDFDFIQSIERAAPNYRNYTTLQTYYHIAAWQPFGSLPLVAAPTRTLMLTPADDRISKPEAQADVFDQIAGPKLRHVEPGKGHMDILSGDSFAPLMAMQIEFLHQAKSIV